MVEGTLVGAYRVVKQIGAGGMGEVWLAEHTLLARRAAIKFLHPARTTSSDTVTRFFNEARAAAAIADAGIVQIFDYGHHTDGTAYIVMELLVGETLDARCRTRTPSITDALRIMRQVASSLGEAHARGIVHRDLKPENIFLVRDLEVPGGERAKILDFGIAKIASNVAVRTETDAVMGTPTYMSPEQCRGAGGVDQRSDVYSLGCVLFRTIAGRPPFISDGMGDLIVKHVTEPAPRLSIYVKDVPPAVDDLVAKCLEKDPDRRFDTSLQLAAAIGAILGQPSIPMSSLVADLHQTTLCGTAEGTPAPAPDTTLSGSAVSLPASLRRRRLVLGGAMLLGLSGSIWAWMTLRANQHHSIDILPVQSPPRVEIVSVDATSSIPDATPVSADDTSKLAIAALRGALMVFLDWSRTHPSSPCPADLVFAPDPWGSRLHLTCTEQPENQVVGIVSAGPDRVFRTSDDIQSWSTGTDLTSMVTGPRWKPKIKSPQIPAREVRHGSGAGSAITGPSIRQTSATTSSGPGGPATPERSGPADHGGTHVPPTKPSEVKEGSAAQCQTGRMCFWADQRFANTFKSTAASLFNFQDINFNDETSSIWNRTTVAWLLYEDAGYSDTRICVKAGASVANLANFRFNDKVSSAQRLAEDTCPSGIIVFSGAN